MAFFLLFHQRSRGFGVDMLISDLRLSMCSRMMCVLGVSCSEFVSCYVAL